MRQLVADMPRECLLVFFVAFVTPGFVADEVIQRCKFGETSESLLCTVFVVAEAVQNSEHLKGRSIGGIYTEGPVCIMTSALVMVVAEVKTGEFGICCAAD